jgi:tetratricopeptide (TPR) repeat protein/tRNA A-37 threonylcarbamoyl transferase component Bud32
MVPEQTGDRTWIDERADDFERAWRDGPRPRIEVYLADVTEPRRTRLLEELLRVERQLALEAGESPAPAEYRRRFPAHVAVVETVFADDRTAPTLSVARRAAKRTGDRACPDPDPGRTASITQATTSGGRYRVLRPHARGGLGAVFVALDAELNREVALKQLLDHRADDPASRARFLREARITGGLEHPGIVPIYGLGSYDDGRPFYAMRFVRGDSLKEAIDRFHTDEGLKSDPGRRSLEWRQLLRRFLDVCNATDYAHSRGVLHRDIKPDNVIVGRHGETLVIDWGLAKPVGRHDRESDPGDRTLGPSSSGAATLPGSVLGTPAYMSPEQAAGDFDRLGPRSDVYSLGATLYCLLTGRPPFEGDDVDEVLRAVQAGDFPRPRTPDPALEAVCCKAMARAPEDRYTTPKALADDVERWLADEPVTAWREPWLRRARRWARRHRTAVTAATVALLAGLAAAAGVQARANTALEAKNLQLTTANAATTRALAEARQAKAATDAALAQSEESLKQAEAVSTFLVEAFRSPDPSQAGRDVKVADVLDRAVDRLHKEFSGSPATKGRLLDALGMTYYGLGLYEASTAIHAKALVEREAALPPDHSDTLTSRANLAAAYLAAGQPAEALSLFEVTLKAQESKLGPDHPDTFASRINLATTYLAVGRTAEAVTLLEANSRRLELVLGPDHPDTLTGRNDLAEAYAAAGRTAEAVELHRATLGRIEARLGPDHPDTLASRSNLAVAYDRAGRSAEAIPLHERTLRLREAKLGPDHPDTLASRNNLAEAYVAAGRAAEAIELHRATLGRIEARLGPDHPDTLLSRNNLAVACLAAGRAAEAVELHRATLGRIEAKLGPDHPDTLRVCINLGAAYHSAGRTAEAVELHRATLGRIEAKLGPDHPDTLTCRNNLATAYVAAGRTAEAIELHRATLELRERKLGPDHPHTIRSCVNLGAAYVAAGRAAEAIELHRATHARIEAEFGPDHPDALASRRNLAGAYETAGRWVDAEPLWREIVARRRKTTPPDSPLLADDLAGLGNNLLKRGRWSEAEPPLRECLAIRTEARPDDYRRFAAMSQIGEALLGQGRHADAESLIVPGYEGIKARAARIPPQSRGDRREAGLRVVRLYEAWGKPEQAAAWKAKLGLADLPADVFARP